MRCLGCRALAWSVHAFLTTHHGQRASIGLRSDREQQFEHSTGALHHNGGVGRSYTSADEHHLQPTSSHGSK